MKLAMERCTNVGYPANFRQPQTEAYFRKIGTANRDLQLRWTGPVARIRVNVGGQTGDVTGRRGTLASGKADIIVHIDFSQTMPCFFLAGEQFSTNMGWEASLDGENWVPAETFDYSDPAVLPDTDRDETITLPVVRVIKPEGPAQSAYAVETSNDLIVDFQETELGSLRFDVTGEGSLCVQVGESVDEVSDPDLRWFEQYALEAISLGQTRQAIAFPERALRYVRFSTTGKASISRLRFDARRAPVEEKGRFQSNDTDLNAIWSVAVATLRSNMHDFYLDGIRRDGLIWHDGPLTLEAFERVFFDKDLSRQTLVAETLPEHPDAGDVGILDSPMYSLVGFEREWMVRGDNSFARLFRPRIEDMLAFLISLQDEHGIVNARRVEPYGFFPDWSAPKDGGPDAHGAPAYAQMLLVGAFAAGARLAEAWGDQAAHQRYDTIAKKLKITIRREFYRPVEGLFCNGYDRDGKLDTGFTSFAQCFAIAFDIAEPDEYDRLIDFLNDGSKRPTRYSLSQVVELSAYAKAGRAADAVGRLKAAWLPLIKAGYRRFFEDIDAKKSADQQLGMYDRKYAASLCHAWAGAAPVMALSQGILGVEPLSPGYARCRVAPQRCGLQNVEGCIPTPAGPIEISWKGSQGTLILPKGIVAESGKKVLHGPGRFKINVT
ncbi:alpha-L-rhamnosidase [Sphingobium sp. AP50]|nr:alpha-L-rhamnosidase [Sphingobium sp. AP50]